MWGLKRKPQIEGFPEGFRIQRIGVTSAVNISHLSPQEIANYFRERPGIAMGLLTESEDKRYHPSTFISQQQDGSFTVGWYARKTGRECVKQFDNLADAATDYLLFSLGKSRWTPPAPKSQ